MDFLSESDKINKLESKSQYYFNVQLNDLLRFL